MKAFWLAIIELYQKQLLLYKFVIFHRKLGI